MRLPPRERYRRRSRLRLTPSLAASFGCRQCGRKANDVTAPRTVLTVEQARREVARRLASRSVDSAELDARLLAGHALNLDLTSMIAAANRVMTAEESGRLEAVASRRLAGEPVARIVGE